MDRTKLNRWICDLIKEVLKTKGAKICGWSGKTYRLQYTKRGLAHTVYAHCTSRGATKDDNISIDIVAGIKFGHREWITTKNRWPFKYKCEKWFAVPKPSHCGPSDTSDISFMVCNPKAEQDLLHNKRNLKIVFRLMKSLRDEYGLHRLKSYFFTTIFLHAIAKQKRLKKFWDKPLEELFIYVSKIYIKPFLLIPYTIGAIIRITIN